MALFLGTQTSNAVILFGSGDLSYNTTPPTGALTNSGWQYEGQWGGFLGTPITPQYFIAAKHVGGSVGQTFTFNCVSYKTTARWDDPNSDLRIWKVNGVFPNYAPLYSTSDETGKPLVVIGRGTQRGNPVTVTNAQTQTPAIHGWKDGPADGVMRWGQNQVCLAACAFLMAAFTGTQGANEAYLSSGDSSGAVFIQDNSGVWKLAGINYAIDGPFSTTASRPAFYGAISDESGLYEDGLFMPNNGVAQPSYFLRYARLLGAGLDSEHCWHCAAGVFQPFVRFHGFHVAEPQHPDVWRKRHFVLSNQCRGLHTAIEQSAGQWRGVANREQFGRG